MLLTRFLGLVLGLVLAAFATEASAQPAPLAPTAAEAEGPRPWADGVPEDEQTIALGFYGQGNAEFVESRFAQALAKYRRAIEHWDHPAIRFNMAVCLINLGQLVEARDALERGLAYGAAPLGEDAHREALTYRKLLDGQLTRLTVTCDEAGAVVTLDGKHLLTGPAQASPYLLPGDHQIVATKPGFLATTKTLALVAGATATFDVELFVEAPRTIMARRWERWRPYAVMAAGAVIAGLGALPYAAAAGDFDDYDDGVHAACPRGCNAAEVAELSDLRATKDRAEVERAVAVSLFAVGGAAFAAGAIGLIVNQPREVPAPARALPAVTPVPGGATLTLLWAF